MPVAFIAGIHTNLPGRCTIEADRDHEIGSGLFPWIPIAEPIIGLFELPSVFDSLREDAVLVTQSVSISRQT